MSRINIIKVEGFDDSGDVISIRLVSETDHSFRDGEELTAAARIIGLVDELDNGEALVIWKVIF